MKIYLLGLLIGLSSFGVQAQTVSQGSQLKKSTEGIGRCYMDECTWLKVKNKKVIQQAKTITKVKATVISGSYPMEGDEPITWYKTPFNVVAECSKTRPSLIGQGETIRLNVKDFAGVEESNVNLYFLICHDYANGAYDGAKRFKY